MKRENLKSILLVLLFATSLFFTQRLWFYLPFGQVISRANEIDLADIDFDVSDILSPQRFVISLGGLEQEHIVFFSEPYEVWNITDAEVKNDVSIWNVAKDVLKNYLGNDYNVDEITFEEWKKIKKFKSIRMDFACELPGESLITALTDQNSNTAETIDAISTILIPATESERNNIYLGNDEKFFRLTGSVKDNKIRELIENIEKIGYERGYVSYYPLKKYFGGENEVLAPVFNEDHIPSYKASTGINVSDKAQISTLLDKFFAYKLDFVKEITEADGTVIYMYGYLEKILKISKNGTLEYIEKFDKDQVGDNLDFIDSLKYAVAFVEDHLGWPTYSNIENAYLSDYEPVERDNVKGYRFSFNYRMSRLPVYIPDIGKDKGIEVEIIGDQVTYYKRIVKGAGSKLNIEEEQEKVAPFINKIWEKSNSRNYSNIKYVYMVENELKEEDVKDFKISEIIEDVRLYYYYHENKGELIPVWEITIDDIAYYFDLYTGEQYTFQTKN